MDRPEVNRPAAHTSLLRNYAVLLYTVAMLAVVLTVSLLGFAADRSYLLLMKRVLRWRE